MTFHLDLAKSPCFKFFWQRPFLVESFSSVNTEVTEVHGTPEQESLDGAVLHILPHDVWGGKASDGYLPGETRLAHRKGGTRQRDGRYPENAFEVRVGFQ